MQPTRIVIATLAITIGATAAPAPAHAGRGPAVLAVLPEDTTLLVGLDLKKVFKAPIAADAVTLIKTQAASQLAKIKSAGIDIEKDVTKVFVALAGAGLTNADSARLKILVAEGSFKIDAAAMTDPTKTHEGVTYWATADADVALIGKRLFIVSDGHMPDVIDVIKGKASNAAKGSAAKKLRNAIGKTTVTDPGWMVAVITDAERTAMGTGSADVDWFSGSAALRKDAVDVAVRVGTTSATAAKTMADTVGAQIDSARQMMSSAGLADLGKSLNVATSGSVVAMGATVTKTEIGTIMNLMSLMTSSMATSTSPPPPAPKTAPTIPPAKTPKGP
jgi:hypothetical protein